MLRGARHKTFVASAQLTPGFGGGVGPCRWLLAHGWGSFTLPWCGNCFGAWGLVPLFWCCYCFWMAGPMAVAISWNSGSVAVPRRTNVVVRWGVGWCCLCNKGGEPGWCGLGTLVKADVLVARGDIADVPGGDARIGVTPELSGVGTPFC